MHSTRVCSLVHDEYDKIKHLIAANDREYIEHVINFCFTKQTGRDRQGIKLDLTRTDSLDQTPHFYNLFIWLPRETKFGDIDLVFIRSISPRRIPEQSMIQYDYDKTLDMMKVAIRIYSGEFIWMRDDRS